VTGIARTRALILVYGLLSATSYCALLPLWEGFDELYHYGYVQHLSHTWSFPTVGQTKVSRELWTSLDFVPVSHFLQPYFQRPTTSFHEYFLLSPEERRLRRAGLEAIDRGLQGQPSPRDNYEPKQAPLSYILLAPFDRLLAGAPLPARVLVLRLLLAIATVLLLWTGTRRLAKRLGLEGGMETAALFVLFSCQMIYGTSCHIANDALMLPWMVFFIASVIDFCRSPIPTQAAVAGLLMGVGLLIKASLLFIVPLAFVVPASLLFRKAPLKQAAKLAAITGGTLLALAGPWYLRNVTLYHNVTATNDTTAGIGLRELVRAAINLPWRESLVGSVHVALWTGNNSFTTFSTWTINLVIALLGVAALSYGLCARPSAPELITITAIALYSVGLVLTALAFFHATRGQTTFILPWYMPVLLGPVVAICFLGLARWGKWGRWTAMVVVLVCGYVAVASWVAKLIPMYGGFEVPHAHTRELLAWYLQNSAQRDSMLSTICPAPLPILYTLLALLLVFLVTSTVATCCSLSNTE
jgi:hypothetical protein